MLLVKTSFLFVFMPYICDPFIRSGSYREGTKNLVPFERSTD